MGLSGRLNWSRRSWNYSYSLGGSYIRNADYEEGKSAYEWDETKSSFGISTGLSLSYRRVGLQLNGISFTDSFVPRLDALLWGASATRFPLRIHLFGAYDDEGMDLHGISRNYGTMLIPAYTLREYPHPKDLDLFWLGGAEVSVGLFSFEIQRNLSHAYFNRFFGRLALRNQIYDSQGHPDAEGIGMDDLRLAQSLMLRLGLTTTFYPVVKYPATFEPSVSLSWKFSNTITGNGFPLHVNMGINFNL